MKIHFGWGIFMVMGLMACSPQLSYFTKNLYEKQGWTQEEVRQIQFYVSRDIVLSRAIKDGETSIVDGKIRIKNGRKIEQVIVRQGTPGVLVLMPKSDRFAVSFEEEGNDAYLMFGPNPNYNNRFALLAQDWEQDRGQVHYRGQLYNVDSKSAFACLMVDLKQLGESEFKTHRAQGRLVKGS
jgi:hypothetical protein